MVTQVTVISLSWRIMVITDAVTPASFLLNEFFFFVQRDITDHCDR